MHSPRNRRSSRPATGLARALSKLGHCSRSQGEALALEGRIRVNGVVRRDPEWRIELGRDRLQVDGKDIASEARMYVMLNKPRGLVTTAADEKGRATVLDCFEGKGLPFISPVGRLDQASEGLLLFTNDTAWGARLTDPAAHVDKIYHVQVDQVLDEATAARVQAGREVEGEFLNAKSVKILRRGEKNCWLEIVLDEGKNRHLRRLLAGFELEVLRLIRIGIGDLRLGELAKGAFRFLNATEVSSLRARGAGSR